jgi:hypothetical protein
MREHRQLRERLVILQQRVRSECIYLLQVLPICHMPVSASAKPIAATVAALAAAAAPAATVAATVAATAEAASHWNPAVSM